MEEYRRRLERTQIEICLLLLVLLFGGLLVLPRVGQFIWVAVIMAIHIRVTHVITRREELIERGRPKHENVLCALVHRLPVLVFRSPYTLTRSGIYLGICITSISFDWPGIPA
jgi:hypothetical protein